MTPESLLASIQINITASTVAWYAAIVGTLGGLKALVDLWNDRGRVEINYQTGMSVRNTNGMYDESKEYFQTEVINKGRRPVVITHVGAKFFNQQETSLFADSFLQGIDRTLTESHPATVYVTDQSGMKLDKLWYVYSIDAKGRESRQYAKNLTWYAKCYYRLRRHKNNKNTPAPKVGVKIK